MRKNVNSVRLGQIRLGSEGFFTFDEMSYREKSWSPDEEVFSGVFVG